MIYWFFTRASSSSSDVLGALDRFSSWRLTGLYETYQAINYDMIFLGLGVNQVTVLGGRFYPHVELARYLVEVGILILTALALYLSPFFKHSTGPVCKFQNSTWFVFCCHAHAAERPTHPFEQQHCLLARFWPLILDEQANAKSLTHFCRACGCRICVPNSNTNRRPSKKH